MAIVIVQLGLSDGSIRRLDPGVCQSDLLRLGFVHCAGRSVRAGRGLHRSGGRAGCSGIRLSAVRERGVLIPVTRLHHLAVLGVDGIHIGMIARGELHLVAGHTSDLAERCG